MNKPDTIDPGAGMSNLKERAARMTEAPHTMSPDAEAAKQLDNAAAAKTKFPDDEGRVATPSPKA